MLTHFRSLHVRPCILLKCEMFAKTNKNDADKVCCVAACFGAPVSETIKKLLTLTSVNRITAW